MRLSAPVAFAFAVLALLPTCSGQPKQVCVPGKSEACVGSGGCAGGQRCNDEGTAFGPCECAPAGGQDAGTALDAGEQDAGATLDAGEQDAGATLDAGDPDAGTQPCNPVTQQGCGSGQKCSWIQLDPALGQVGCVPDGTQALGAECTPGPEGASTGFDNCVAGAVCISAKCATVCDFGSADGGCSPDGVCTRYAGLFGNGAEDPVAGACNSTCNPITQLLPSGANCGSGNGCYLLTSQTETIAVCAAAGVGQHNEDLTGQVFANSCVPGAQPRKKDSNSQTVQCGMLCAPADVTSTTNTTSEGGVAPDTCQLRSATAGTPAADPSDATAGESCRYWWSREPFDVLSPFSNTVGYCFKHTAFEYDSDGDMTPDSPFPRCTTLTTGDLVPPIENPPGNDALYFYCVQAPATYSVGGQALKAPRLAEQPLLDRLGSWRN